MFKAKHQPTDRFLVTVDSEWAPEQLQEWCRRDQVVCPGCGGFVNYRPRKKIRSHFAHRSLTDCRYGEETSFVLEGRALLYSFFRGKAEGKPGWKVDIEVQLPSGEMIDVWVEAPHSTPLAYKLFARGRRSGLSDLTKQVKDAGASLRPILSTDRHSWADEVLPKVKHNLLAVPPTDRHVSFWREWDRYHILTLHEPPEYASLCYLDPEGHRLVLYRDLNVPGECHPNTWDYAEVLEGTFSELMVWRGEIIFPGESSAYNDWKQWEQQEHRRLALEAERRRQAEIEWRRLEEERRKADEERRRREAEKRRKDQEEAARRGLDASIPVPTPGPGRVVPTPRPERPQVAVPSDPPATCIYCGQMTTDYWDRTGDVCRCHACRIRRKGIEPVICSECGKAYEPDKVKEGLCLSCRWVLRKPY